MQRKSELQQWRNTSSVISWFKQIPSKEKSKFSKFDTVDFYPSIIEELLMKSLNYAKSTEAIPVSRYCLIVIMSRLKRKTLISM